MALLRKEEEEEEGQEKEEREEEWREEREMLHRDEEEEGEEVDVLQTETELPPEPLTFSATCDLLTSSMFKPGQHVLVAGAERGIVKFVSHTHFKEGVSIGVELKSQKRKTNGPLMNKDTLTAHHGMRCLYR